MIFAGLSIAGLAIAILMVAELIAQLLFGGETEQMYVSQAKQGDLFIKFPHLLKIVGVDEFNVYLQDENYRIGGLPYIRIFSKQWQFTDALTGCDVGFQIETYQNNRSMK